MKPFSVKFLFFTATHSYCHKKIVQIRFETEEIIFWKIISCTTSIRLIQCKYEFMLHRLKNKRFRSTLLKSKCCVVVNKMQSLSLDFSMSSIKLIEFAKIAFKKLVFFWKIIAKLHFLHVLLQRIILHISL